MKNLLIKSNFLIFILTLLIGCGTCKEFAKVIIGNSTKHLENVRDEAIAKTYLCSFDECFDSVLSLGKNVENIIPKTEKRFYVFSKNRIESNIVFMQIKGNVDTTEVGIFFVPYGQNAHTLEVASLSTTAKTTVAEAVFKELDLNYSEVK